MAEIYPIDLEILNMLGKYRLKNLKIKKKLKIWKLKKNKRNLV